jgi:hypothetical protein
MVKHCLNSYTLPESKEAMLSSSGKHKPTIETGKLLVAELQLFA